MQSIKWIEWNTGENQSVKGWLLLPPVEKLEWSGQRVNLSKQFNLDSDLLYNPQNSSEHFEETIPWKPNKNWTK